jgi:hypothetical protein
MYWNVQFMQGSGQRWQNDKRLGLLNKAERN